MPENYKIKIRLGDAEFEAEGPEDTVKSAYELFLKNLSPRPAKPLEPATHRDLPHKGPGLDSATLNRLFVVDGEALSLKHLPPAGSSTRSADAAILMLYGFHKLLKLDNVPVTKLNEGLRKSGVSLERLDRIMGVHSGLFMKGGTRIGGRYSLNNQGLAQAEDWIKAWFS